MERLPSICFNSPLLHVTAEYTNFSDIDSESRLSTVLPKKPVPQEISKHLL